MIAIGALYNYPVLKKDFALPDRNKYVTMESHFLHSYMILLIQICHHRKAYATGGMAASLLPQTVNERQKVLDRVLSGKLKEMRTGIDGFMVFDRQLVPHIHQLWDQHAPGVNQLHVRHLGVKIQANDLLRTPLGGVTMAGLAHNVAVGVLFINAWLRGYGTFIYQDAVEDSATAEISRSQVWQWIRQQVRLEETGMLVTRHIVMALSRDVISKESRKVNAAQRKDLWRAGKIFLDLISERDFPEFITTYLTTRTNAYEPFSTAYLEDSAGQAKL